MPAIMYHLPTKYAPTGLYLKKAICVWICYWLLLSREDFNVEKLSIGKIKKYIVKKY